MCVEWGGQTKEEDTLPTYLLTDSTLYRWISFQVLPSYISVGSRHSKRLLTVLENFSLIHLDSTCAVLPLTKCG